MPVVEEVYYEMSKLERFLNHNPNLKPMIVGIRGSELSQDERRVFQEVQPLGFILFQRNCLNPPQLKQLIQDLKESVQHPNPPILIDQEGGRVQRLLPPHWPKRPSVGSLQSSSETSESIFFEHGYTIASELSLLGISFNCAPCCDLQFPGAHSIISDRSFGDTVSSVVPRIRAWTRGCIQGGVTPIFKHAPGHGRALVDSHEACPSITTQRSLLEETDFAVFREIYKEWLSPSNSFFTGSLKNSPSLTTPWMMTGHLVFSEIDPNQPTTFSKKVIGEIIRGFIGFQGLLITDCVTMKALSGSFGERARKSWQAGCDIVLYGHSELLEIYEISRAFEA
jgi:beta-N-acetylhexosaminidase